MTFKHKAKKTSRQITITENLDNNEDSKGETYMDLIYTGSRKRQDHLSKLGAWGPWERVEGEGKGREESIEKCRAQ